MTNRREREIKDSIAKVGLELLDYDQTGPHIKVKVCHPLMKDRHKTFIYGRTPQGDYRREKNEEAALIRWKREITEPVNHHLESPIEAAWKKAGLPVNEKLPTPIVHPEPPKKVHVIAHAANQIVHGKPAKWTANTPPPEPRSPEEFRQEIACEVELAHGRDPRNDPVLNAFLDANPDMKAHVEEKAGARPTAAELAARRDALIARRDDLVEEILSPAKEPTVAKEEPIMDTTTSPPTTAKKARHTGPRTGMNMLTRGQEIKLADWIRKPGLLDAPTNSLLLADRATHELGFKVSHSNILGMLRDLDLEIKITRNFRGKYATRYEYLATVMVEIIERLGGHPPEALEKLAVGEKEIDFREAAMPTWPKEG